MKHIIYIFFCFTFSGFSQKLVLKKYSNTDFNITFQIPSSWEVVPKDANNKTECTALCTDEKENLVYKNCFNGIVFYIEKYNLDLNSTLEKKGFIIENDSVYFKDVKGKKNRVQYTQKNNYKGIFYTEKIKINCSSLPKNMQNQGRVDYLFFNLRGGKNTIVIYTTGKSLDINIRTAILDSFKFV